MRVREIFHSVQGEGLHTGTAAVFVRFAGCNLRCPFCDTDFSAGEEMTEEEVFAAASAYPCRSVVLTGGEPTLQMTPSLVRLFKDAGWRVSVETNGTRDLSRELLALVDWVTVSPKEEHVPGAEVRIGRIDELKVIYSGQDISRYRRFEGAVPHLFVQLCDTGDQERNREIYKRCYDFVKGNTQWRLSMQIQKTLNVR